MKHSSLSTLVLATIAIVITSCTQHPDKNTEKSGDAVTTTEEAATTGGNLADRENSFVEPIIKDYLLLKNALAADDDKAAAEAGRRLLASLNQVDVKIFPVLKSKDYTEIAVNAKENAEHIGENAGKIGHQREHLASLSKDIADLIELFGTTQKLYRDYCPMYNDGKGAIWISETREIKNPYYGSKMTTCGSVEKEF